MSDTYNLQRFVSAQERTYEEALKELKRGKKTSHWMWFVFPQIKGLGNSDNAKYYAISGLDEAKAYLDHPVLGARLHECSQTIVDLPETDAESIFGEVDARKLRSSMTLFAHAAPEERLFPAVLAHYFEGQEDEATLRLLGR